MYILGITIPYRAYNSVSDSVRDVQLSISLSNLPPGTVITCSAKGNPSPTFKWQKMENCATWMDIPKTNSNQFTTSDTSSMRYRCVAMNIVRGITYTATSHAFLVNNPGINLLMIWSPVFKADAFSMALPIFQKLHVDVNRMP